MEKRKIDDADYIECLPTQVYKQHYMRWKERILPQMGALVAALRVKPLEDVMGDFSLTPRDVTLLVQLKYLTAEEVEEFGLEKFAEVTVL